MLNVTGEKMTKIEADAKIEVLRKSLADAKTQEEKEKLSLELAKVTAISLSLGTPMNRMVKTNE